jgi:hypothetical protein
MQRHVIYAAMNHIAPFLVMFGIVMLIHFNLTLRIVLNILFQKILIQKYLKALAA